MFTVDSDLMKKLDYKFQYSPLLSLMTPVTSVITSFLCSVFLLDLSAIGSDFFSTFLLVLSFFLVTINGMRSCMKLFLSLSVWKTCATDSTERKWLTIECLLLHALIMPLFILFSFLWTAEADSFLMVLWILVASFAISIAFAIFLSMCIADILEGVLSRYTPREEDDVFDDKLIKKTSDGIFSFPYIELHDSFSEDITLLNKAIQLVNESSLMQSIENKHSIETSLSRIQSSIELFDQLRENKKPKANETILNAIKKTKTLLEEEIEIYEESLLLEIEKQCALIPEKNHQ